MDGDETGSGGTFMAGSDQLGDIVLIDARVEIRIRLASGLCPLMPISGSSIW